VKLYSYPTYYRYGIVAAATGIPGPDQNTCTFSEILEVDRYGMVSYYNWSNYIVRPTGPTVLELDKWYHLAATLTPAGSGRERWVRLYVNGVPGNPAWSSLGADWGNQFVFSFRNRCWGYRWDHDRFDGAIDEVAFYDRALTPEEIQQHYEDGLRGLGYETVVPVDIDVKPGSDPNCFNINGHGVIPVAILGSANFDVNEIDVGTLLFGGLEVRVRGNGPLCHVEDTDADQFPDLVCQFQDDADAWLEGDATATLTGELLDGTRFQGTDQICIVP
jgi:hypothetical protein